ncbi:TonB-dependent receptor [Luteimonas panaciterrae]|uniref:TonB-dependent receptor n=1 Tax=Luteimonas panaciterrae TaxID=363885 RepID=UPI001CFAB736|nr:TonB-dependent receptor [Luteimonas panaciterrae]
MTTKTHTLRDAIALALAVGSAAFATAGTAFAQDAASGDETKTLDRIQVTGSNIPRTDAETASPVQIISRQEIDRTGKTSLADYLQTLTVDGAGSIPKSFGGGFAAGGTGVSLRGLGAGSTLVLLNGRRMAPFGLADDGQKTFTDLSTIPLEAVERVEVLKDGASAIYGSDAIAGVVNVILRKDFEGATVKASYGTSQDGGGSERKGSLTWGTGDLSSDGYNFFFNIEGSKLDRITIKDRKDRKWIGSGDSRRWGYALTDSNLAGWLPGGTLTPGSSPLGAIRRPDGTWQGLGTAADCARFSKVDQTDANGGCIWDPNLLSDMMPEESYVNFFARGTFALSDSAELYTEFGYSNKKSSFDSTPSGVSGAGGFPGGIVNNASGPTATILGALHPDNPIGVDGRLRYSTFANVGTRSGEVQNDFMRFLAGVKGTAGAWDYDVGYMHSQTSLNQTQRGYIRKSVLHEVLTNPNNAYGGWLRLGANAGLTPQSVLDAVSPDLKDSSKTGLDLVDFKLSRALMDLRGGQLGIAMGAEWRRQTATRNPTPYTDVGDIVGLGYSAFSGSQTVTAAYVELNAPVLESLELNAAGRFDSYKDGDNSFTPKFGAKWKPTDWLAIRGSYARGFRAPNLAELNGFSVGFTGLADPVRCPGGVPIASGIACTPTVAAANQANPNLKPEKSKSYSLGIVLQPTSSTSLTIDGWQIERTDEIIPLDAGIALQQGLFVRGDDEVPGFPGSGTLLAVFTPYINADSSKVRGVDLDFQQKFDIGNYGKLRLDMQWSHLIRYERTVNGETINFAGTHDNCNVTNCIGTPKDRINLGLTWDVGDWSVSGVVNYRGKFDNTEPLNNHEWDSENKQYLCTTVYADGRDAPGGCEIPSFYSIDLSANWKATDSWEVFGSIQNVTDRIAPLDLTTYGGLHYNPLDVSGAIGRYFTIGAKFNFK